MFQQELQHLEGLFLQTHRRAILAQFDRGQINFKDSEADNSAGGIAGRRGHWVTRGSVAFRGRSAGVPPHFDGRPASRG